MVVISSIAKSKIVAAIGAAIAVFGSNPALANSAASADIAAPLRAAQAARQNSVGNGDEQFRQLFATWKQMDRSNSASLAASNAPVRAVARIDGMGPITATGRSFRRDAVSIPSRVPVEGIRLSSDFGMRVHPVLGGMRTHKGVDLAGPVGTPVHATADGVISKAEWFSSYGLYVAIEHGAAIQTRYGHMSRLNVAAGQYVHKGDVIGFVGSTGRSTGPHLHYEVRVAGEAVNPVPYMQADQLAAAVNPSSRANGQGGAD